MGSRSLGKTTKSFPQPLTKNHPRPFQKVGDKIWLNSYNYLPETFFLTLTLKVLIIDVMKNESKKFTLAELCALVEMNKRKIRFYMQKGLVDRPEGTGKGSYYTHNHLEQLLAIRKWKAAGLTLERIQDLLTSETEMSDSGRPLPPPRPKRPGSIEVWSHILISDGIELHIEPQRSGLNPEQIRSLCRTLLVQYEKNKTGGN